jgi:hypothetical protein
VPSLNQVHVLDDAAAVRGPENSVRLIFLQPVEMRPLTLLTVRLHRQWLKARKDQLVVYIADIGTQLTRSRPKTSGPAMTPPSWSSRRCWWQWQQQPTASREQHVTLPHTQLPSNCALRGIPVSRAYLNIPSLGMWCTSNAGGPMTAGSGTASGAACGRSYRQWCWTICWWDLPSRQPAGELPACAGAGSQHGLM